MNKPQLVVALDFPEPQAALDLAKILRGSVCWVKIGLELFLAGGQPLLEAIKNMDFRIFLDLKFLDIPNTVQAATGRATRMGVDMLTVHTLGGEKMCRAALAGRDDTLHRGQNQPLILGVTLLTSLGPTDLAWNPRGTEQDMLDLTVRLATDAQRWKLDGVVCSGREVRAIRRACHSPFTILTPGIRLPDTETDDQTRICTPAQAAQEGSTFLVVGRPITRAMNPLATAEQYLAEIR